MTDTELAHRMADIFEKADIGPSDAIGKLRKAFPEPPNPKDGEWWIGKDIHYNTCVKCYKDHNWYSSADFTSPYTFTFTPIRKMKNGEWWLGKDRHGDTCVKYYNNKSWFYSPGLSGNNVHEHTFTPIRKMKEAQ